MMDFHKDKPYIFMSYSHKDSEIVLPIVKELERNKINIWYDEGIEAGSEWPEYIAQKIISCDRFVCFISDAYPMSQNCSRELNFAIAEGKDVLSVYTSEKVSLPAGMRMQLGSYQAVFIDRFKSVEKFGEYLCKERFMKSCEIVDCIENNEDLGQPHNPGDDNINVEKGDAGEKSHKGSLDEEYKEIPVSNDKRDIKQKKKISPKFISKGKRVLSVALLTYLFFLLLCVMLVAPSVNWAYEELFPIGVATLLITGCARVWYCVRKNSISASKFTKWMIILYVAVIELFFDVFFCLIFIEVLPLIIGNIIASIIDFSIVLKIWGAKNKRA